MGIYLLGWLITFIIFIVHDWDMCGTLGDFIGLIVVKLWASFFWPFIVFYWVWNKLIANKSKEKSAVKITPELPIKTSNELAVGTCSWCKKQFLLKDLKTVLKGRYRLCFFCLSALTSQDEYEGCTEAEIIADLERIFNTENK